MTKRGKYIVFEGIGGSGKGTQVKLTEEWLSEMGKKVLVTCEHTRDTSPGMLIEKIIKGVEPAIDPVALQLMYVADRANHTMQVIIPGLNNYDYILGDRYEASTITYAPKKKRDYFVMVNRGVTVRPELTVMIDLDPVEAVKRVNGRKDADIFDRVEKLKKCRASYRWYFKNADCPCAWIDGNGTREEVFERVKKEIKKRGII
jgi:dTMP kinase